MKARRNGFASGAAVPTIGAAALVLATLVAVIGSAQAAPSTKLYDASVRVTGGQVDVPEEQHNAVSATLRLTLTNKGKQTLGSANFDPPSGVNPSGNVFVASQTGWTAKFEDGVVKFRSSTAPALTKDGFVFADVPVTFSGCTDAEWTTEAKQSNDFSGQPGNSFLPGVLDLTPLGSFDVDPIQTEEGLQVIPAILTGVPFTWTATAYDVCGDAKTTYRGATLTPTLLTGAGPSTFPSAGLDWSDGLGGFDGVGEVTFTPDVTETDNRLTLTDPGTGVFEASNFFDTTDTLCTPADTLPCQWEDEQKKIIAESEAPTGNANLGIGFNTNLNFECEDATDTVGNPPTALVNINPRGYEDPFTVALTYKKSAVGSGPASSFIVCLSDDNGATWTKGLEEGEDSLSPCASSPPADNEAPCIQTLKRVSGGDLLVELWLDPNDPWTGLG